MDIKKTVEPKSDQLNYDDVASAPLTVTIVEVKAGPPDQPVELHNAEYPGRPYKPGKSMRRVLIAAWGAEASAYVGRKALLYGDPTITFGKDAVGGIRIRALSHITEPLTVPLTVTRGRRTPFTVQPLPTDTDNVTRALKGIADCTDAGTLDQIENWAKEVGIAGIASVKEALTEKRAILGASATDSWDVAPIPDAEVPA
jgi:hypothetical protein